MGKVSSQVQPVKKKKRKNGRAKGGNAERELAKLFSKWWGAEFARTPMSGGFHTKKFRDDWNAGSDLVTPDPTFPFAVESKRHEGWCLDQLLTAPKCEIWAWWEQACGQAPEDKMPLLVFRRNNQPWLFMIRQSDFQELDGLTSVFDVLVADRIVTIGLLSELMTIPKDTMKMFVGV